MLKKLITFGCATAIALTCCGIAAAQMPSKGKPVYFTFSKPVDLPRVTLPAGKYLFRLADTLSARTIVQVFSEDGKKLHGIFITMPIERPTASSNPEIRFLETAANAPAAIATYWYPGDRAGWEFVYPRDQATRLARSSKRPVLSTVGTATGDEIRTAELARISPEGQQLPLGPLSDSPTVVGESIPGEIAPDMPVMAALAPAPETAMSQTAVNRAPRTRLPSTASFTPTITLVGLFALCAALGLGLWRRVQA
jgi:hypothetical protein